MISYFKYLYDYVQYKQLVKSDPDWYNLMPSQLYQEKQLLTPIAYYKAQKLRNLFITTARNRKAAHIKRSTFTCNQSTNFSSLTKG